MQKNFTVSNNDTETALSQVLRYIHETLAAMKLTGRDINRAELMCEEAAASLLTHGIFSDGSSIRVKVSKFFGNVNIKLTVPGEEFAFTGGMYDALSLDDETSPETAEAIRNMLLRSFSENLRYRHAGKYNIITIRALTSSYAGLYIILGAVFSAVIASLIMRSFLPESVCMAVNDNIFVPVRSIFMNGLKLCAIPVVFFSILSCMADSGSMSGIKRTGSKILSCFLMTQIITLMIGFGVMFVFQPGEGAALTSTSPVNTELESFSVISTIVNVIPSDIVRPFLEGNMLQLIALAVILGVSAGVSGAKSVIHIFGELNEIFMKATEIFMKIIPLVVFCSIASMILTSGTTVILSVLGIILTLLTGYVLLHIVYMLIIKFSAHMNPARVYSESLPMLITAMSTCSSVASIPDSIRVSEKLSIPSRIHSFTFPLGISVFKNEACLFFIVAALSAANLYGLHFTSGEMISLVISILVLASATPSIPNGGIAILSVLLVQIGCPLEIMPLFMVVESCLDMIATPTICMGAMMLGLVASADERGRNE